MQVENVAEKQTDARILYESCPLCESKNFVKSTLGDCSQHELYHPKVPPKMQWMNCEDCKHQFIDGYLTDEAADLVFHPNYLKLVTKLKRIICGFGNN